MTQPYSEEQSSLKYKLALFQTFNSFFSNVVGDVLGHPLDTIRVSFDVRHNSAIQVRKQIEVTNKSSWMLTQELFQQEGAQAFFKGYMAPLVGKIPSQTVYAFSPIN